jgi:hypothetical protein
MATRTFTFDSTSDYPSVSDLVVKKLGICQSQLRELN